VCGSQLSAAENVPIVSWLALRGRCRHCGTPIAVRYPLVEGAMGAVFATTAAVVGQSWQLVPLLLLGASLVVVVGIDVDGYVTPPPVLAVLCLAVGANVVVTLAGGDGRALLRGLLAGAVSGVVGAVAAPELRDASATSARVARGVVAGTLGWFAGWASATAGVVVVAVFAVTTVVARTAGGSADTGAGGGAPDPAEVRRGGRGHVPLWLPAVLSYGVVLGAVAAR
jgi:leader peptidase (prepilin peptidase)/N-methyltransferase